MRRGIASSGMYPVRAPFISYAIRRPNGAAHIGRPPEAAPDIGERAIALIPATPKTPPRDKLNQRWYRLERVRRRASRWRRRLCLLERRNPALPLRASIFIEQVSRQSSRFMGRKDRRRTEGSRLLPGINRMS